jgi:hypothetical protein
VNGFVALVQWLFGFGTMGQWLIGLWDNGYVALVVYVALWLGYNGYVALVLCGIRLWDNGYGLEDDSDCGARVRIYDCIWTCACDSQQTFRHAHSFHQGGSFGAQGIPWEGTYHGRGTLGNPKDPMGGDPWEPKGPHLSCGYHLPFGLNIET